MADIAAGEPPIVVTAASATTRVSNTTSNATTVLPAVTPVMVIWLGLTLSATAKLVVN